MSACECPREAEVLEAVSCGRWPDSCGSELHQHLQLCSTCSEVAVLASALQEESVRLASEAGMPSSGLVWWRAELRARREASRSAERPLTLLRAFAGACTIGVIVALAVRVSSWFGKSIEAVFSWMPDYTTLLFRHLPLAVTLAAILILAPVAFYFVVSDK